MAACRLAARSGRFGSRVRSVRRGVDDAAPCTFPARFCADRIALCRVRPGASIDAELPPSVTGLDDRRKNVCCWMAASHRCWHADLDSRTKWFTTVVSGAVWPPPSRVCRQSISRFLLKERFLICFQLTCSGMARGRYRLTCRRKERFDFRSCLPPARGSNTLRRAQCYAVTTPIGVLRAVSPHCRVAVS